MADIVTIGNSSQEFQERMKERMRAAMGDLMPGEVLREIVAKGVEEAFFTGTVTLGRWGSKTTTEPWCVTFVRKEFEIQVQKAVETWIKENPDKFTKIVSEELSGGVLRAVAKAINRLTEDPMIDLQSKVYDIARKLNS